MSILNRLFRMRQRLPLRNAITLVSEQLAFVESRDHVSVWRTAEGDHLGIYFFSIPPDLPTAASTPGVFLSQYRTLLSSAGVKPIECSLVYVHVYRAVTSIVSVAQQPSGQSYLGAITIPFRSFSFVVKLQCREDGVTGMRKAIILDRLLGEGRASVDSAGCIHSDVEPDDVSFDVDFPDHPLSRIRRWLPIVAQAVAPDPSLAVVPRFTLPEGAA